VTTGTLAYTITLSVTVHDPQALYDAAFDHLTGQGGEPEDVRLALLDEGEIDVETCLAMLADPGVSWPGTSIEDTSAEWSGHTVERLMFRALFREDKP
jgi:hypothetical protein